MKFCSLLAVAVLSLPSTVSAQTPPVNRETVWFKPSLTVNTSPVCAEILRVEQEAFFSKHDRSEYTGLKPVATDREKNTDWQVEIVDSRELILKLDGQPVPVRFTRFAAAGGLRVNEGLEIGSKDGWNEAPAGLGWTLYKAPDEQFYAIGVLAYEARLHAYRVGAPTRLDLVCEVVLQPEHFSDNEDPAIRQAWQSTEALREVLRSISRGTGNCGEPGYEHAYQPFAQVFKEVLYRPWGTPESEEFDFEPGFPRSLSEFARRRRTLPAPNADRQRQVWALGGIADYRAWQNYLVQLDRTIAELGIFYRRKFAWSEAQAREEADRVIRGVLNRSVTDLLFYDPEAAGLPLRRAILEHQPLNVIKQLELVEHPDEFTFRSEYRNYDSILNLAVEYPEALQYLLSRGLDPNVKNQFGKTPLMYAAQYNQLESTRILLAAGADPNAATHLPKDDCYYTIRTSGMTPLHYAARYSSAQLIRMLVAAGASTFAKTRTEDPVAEEYPLDWLEKYSAPGLEKNPNLAAAELRALLGLLRPVEE